MRSICLLLLLILWAPLGMGSGCDRKETRKATFEGPENKYEIKIESSEKD